MVSVAVVDDQELVRAGFVALLSAAEGIEVVGEAGQGEEAVRMVRAVHPDVVMMDIRMPVLNGIEATRRIIADPDCAGTRVVVLTTFVLDEYVFGALRAGATGFLLKDTAPEQLLHAVRVAADGDALLSPSIARRLVEIFATTPQPAPRRTVPELTDRVADVLALVAQGLSNADIAPAAADRPGHGEDLREPVAHQARSHHQGSPGHPRLRVRPRLPLSAGQPNPRRPPWDWPHRHAMASGQRPLA